MKTNSVVLALVVLFLTAFAGAQSTPYSTNVFSATFNSSVSVRQSGTTGGTSTNVFYLSSSARVPQVVGVRTINPPGIDVNQASLNVYAADALKGGKIQDDRKDALIQGHISTYVNAHYTDEANILTRRRSLTIILNARTVILIMQEAEASNDDGGARDWDTLIKSLVISEKTCWLPEGCNESK